MSVRRSAVTVSAVLAAALCTAVPPVADAAPTAAAEILNCTVNAAVNFSPPLSAGPEATTVAIGGTASGCLDSQGGPTAVTGGTVTATLKFGTLSCNPLTPPAMAPGSTATFTWNLKDGTQASSTITDIAVVDVDGAGTLTGTVTGSSTRLAGENLTTVLNIDSDQPILDNCVDVLLGVGQPIAQSTLTADAAFS
ncbi:hypothetical protein AB0O82_23650 [Kitasatospora sp. NPDC088264]|uniref:hypothetical protein n=1 Tax=Kitasatospora sp. NPDC088264 TaxID=3155296 RepID=UPI0034366A56